MVSQENKVKMQEPAIISKHATCSVWSFIYLLLSFIKIYTQHKVALQFSLSLSHSLFIFSLFSFLLCTKLIFSFSLPSYTVVLDVVVQHNHYYHYFSHFRHYHCYSKRSNPLAGKYEEQAAIPLLLIIKKYVYCCMLPAANCTRRKFLCEFGPRYACVCVCVCVTRHIA